MSGNSEPLRNGKAAALARLAQADADARRAGTDPRQSAPNIGELRAVGAAEKDFRWLIRRRYAEALTELTRPGDMAPTFGEFTGRAFRENTRFVLTYAGRLFARSHRLNGAALPAAKRPASQRIEWDPATRELRVDGQVAKRFKRRAPTLWAVLDAFAEAKWPRPLVIELKCGGRAVHRLREIVADLNEGLEPSLLYFQLNGDGGVTFRLGRVEKASLRAPAHQ
ncbi:MAG TPA: hypothetical protein PK867_24910 [Pirellulales bacterium]|nr:hypothetical protein [Pirellulales bacterium]